MEFQFRGVWLPAEILRALEAGQVNTREVVLLAMVDALVTPERGCWASNDYLAKRLGCSGETVRRMLQRLESLGLVRRILKQGWRREIETAWSRLTPHNSVEGAPQDCGGYNKPEKGVQMPFFDGPQQNDTHKRQAEQLAAAVRQVLPGRRCSVQAWAAEFATLAQEASPERVEAALVWYGQHIGGDYIPQAYSGKTFRQKFPNIEAAMRRHRGGEACVQPSEEALRLVERLSVITWPKGSGKQLPEAVEISLQRYTAWRQALGWVVDDPPSQAMGRFAVYVKRLCPTPGKHVQEWFEAICRDVSGWDGWNGDLVRRAWRHDSKEFDRWGRQLAVEFAGNAERWGGLQTTIGIWLQG